MSRKKYILLLSLAMVLALSVAAYNYLFGGHRDIATEAAAFEMSAVALGTAMGESQKSPMYIDKTIQTHGTITTMELESVTLDERVQVNFAGGVPDQLGMGTHITIKGRCVGYDDLLEIVKIDQAVHIR